jgi:hypothetical protein
MALEILSIVVQSVSATWGSSIRWLPRRVCEMRGTVREKQHALEDAATSPLTRAAPREMVFVFPNYWYSNVLSPLLLKHLMDTVRVIEPSK